MSVRKLPVFLLTAFVICVFFMKGMVLLDPDFGWHLKMGQIISSSGIPATDPFSYTMPSFPFIDHEWLTNVIISKLYLLFNKVGLAAFYALMTLFALIITLVNPLSRKLPSNRLNFWNRIVIPFLLGAATLLLYSGIRPQVQSWLYLAILLWVLLNEVIWKRCRFGLPILYVFWVNLHGSFALGITTLFLTIILRSLRLKKVEAADVLVGMLSLLATFVNPYGTRIWHEVWMQISDTALRWTIVEWMPALLAFNIPLIILFPFSLLLIWKYKEKFYLEEKGLYLFFLAQGLASTRHIPLWVIVTLPLVSLGIEYLYKDIEKIKFGLDRFNKVLKFGFFCCLGIFALESVPNINSAQLLSEKAFYPLKAVQYLKVKLPEGQIFSSYGWGGYLIWKLPEKKVFIDGRMPSWRWKTDLPDESSYAMKDYGAIQEGRISFKEVFKKYGIATVLWPVPQPESLFEQLDKRLENILVRLGRKRRDFNLLKELEKDGWQKVYEDNIAVIFQKP